MKRSFFTLCILALVLVCTLCLLPDAQAATTVASGTCGTDGDNLTWTLDDTGLLTISGTGAMANYPYSYDAPWHESCLDLIQQVVIQDGVTTIGRNAFNSCYNLTFVSIPDSVTDIGYAAFQSCDNLPSVTIPDSVTLIGDYAFLYCRSLTGIWVDSGNPAYCSDRSGVLFNKNKTHLIASPGGISGAYTIPDSVTTICYSAFRSCSKLTSVTIPDGVSVIQNWTFGTCTQLSSVTIGSGVTAIEYCAFDYNPKLTNVYFNGSKAQWDAIVIGSTNTYLVNANIHICGISIEQQPKAAVVNEGLLATFTTKADSEDVTYQWQYSPNGGKSWYNATSATAGYNSDTLTVSGARSRNGFLYRCRITANSGRVYYTDAVTLTVNNADLNIVAQPEDTTAQVGRTVTFTVAAEGEGLTYRWQYSVNGKYWMNSSDYTTGYNTPSLSVVAAAMRNGYLYRCCITNENGVKVYTRTAKLTVASPFATQPVSQTVAEGGKAVFSVETQGEIQSIQWQYQTKPGQAWHYSTAATQGYNTDTLTVNAETKRNGFAYRCVITDSEGYVHISEVVYLTVE